MDVGVHPDLGALAGLIGTWAGSGEGSYPTIEPFSYREEVVFGHVGKPFVAYRQATVNLATGQPAHAEAGYLRAVAPGQVELVLVHPTGIVELAEGDIAAQPDGLSLHLVTTTVPRTATAKEVTSVERRIAVVGDTLRYEVAMGAVGQPHQHHLSAELKRTGSGASATQNVAEQDDHRLTRSARQAVPGAQPDASPPPRFACSSIPGEHV